MDGQTLSGRGEAMNSGFEVFAAKYLPIVLGVGVGTAAKYRLQLASGRGVSWKEVAADFLILPMVILLAGIVAGQVGASGEWAGAIGAMVALSANQLIVLLRDRFIQRVASEIDVLQAQKGEARQLGAIVTAAHHIEEEGLNAPTAAKKFGNIAGKDEQ